MAYREVTMLEVKEVLRLWRDGVPKTRIAAQLRIDRKTVRRYVAAAVARGLAPGSG
jgi:DNA-binding NarL/FixJ family response regulator